jgi:arginyl-tRNA synthetase
MSIESTLAQAVSQAMQQLYGVTYDAPNVQIQPTRKEFRGEFTVVVFPLAKQARRAPDAVAAELGTHLATQLDQVQEYEVVKGFLNLSLTSAFWCEHLSFVLSHPAYGTEPAGSKGLVVVEYSSPNTNKPLHLGHLRNNFLGYAVSEILKAYGHSVKKVQVINDRGIHICKSMVAWLRYGNGETPESSGMKGDHLVGKYYVAFEKAYKAEQAALTANGATPEEAAERAPIMREARETLLKWEAKDPETYHLWETMNGWVYSGFDSTYRRMGVDFDKLYYESDTWMLGREVALQGVADGNFIRRPDGSIWADLTGDGLDEKLLLRKDGTAVYITQDIGTALLRYRDFPELIRMVYTVGNEQEYHFKVLFLILRKLGHSWAEHCHHLSYGMVELPEGKMKSREGTVVDADDLMEEVTGAARTLTEELGKLEGMSDEEKNTLFEHIGMAGLKYFLLKVDPKKNMLFNPSESVELQGHTGPFIQYAHARTQSILRKHGKPVPTAPAHAEPGALERHLHLRIHQYPQVIADAATGYNPATLANYLYELVRDFSSFYQNMSILQAGTDELVTYRLQLAQAVARIVKSGMSLLGIQVPDRM